MLKAQEIKISRGLGVSLTYQTTLPHEAERMVALEPSVITAVHSLITRQDPDKAELKTAFFSDTWPLAEHRT